MGLKDVIDKIKSGSGEEQRGRRAAPAERRTPDETTTTLGRSGAPGAPAAQPVPARPVGSAADRPGPASPPAPMPSPPRAPAPAAPSAAPPAAPPPAAPVAAQASAAALVEGPDPSAQTIYAEVPRFERFVTGVLVVVEGEPAGGTFPVFDGANVIGRDPSCDVRLPDEVVSVSRRHAKLTHETGIFYVETLAERNRTVVNDEEVTEACELSDGDLLRLARTTFRFRTIEGT